MEPTVITSNAESKPQQTGTTPVAPKSSGSKKAFLILLVVILTLGIASAGAYFYLQQMNSSQSQQGGSQSSRTGTPTPTPTVSDALFTGTVKKLDKDLGLIKIPDSQLEDEKTNKTSQPINYYEAGTYISGKYDGYTRIIALHVGEGVGIFGEVFVFATKDNQTYVVDGDPKLSLTNTTGSFVYLDKTKVTTIDKLPTEHQQLIELSSGFSLVRKDIANSVETLESDGIDTQAVTLVTDFSQDTQLIFSSISAPNTLKLFSSKVQLLDDGTSKTDFDAANHFIASKTGTYVTDSTGLSYVYDLATKKNADQYVKDLTKYETDYANWITFGDNPANKGKTNPYNPLYPEFRGIGFDKAETDIAKPTYNKYSVAFPQLCSIGSDTYVLQNINDSDITKIGNLENIPLYILKDANHPLNKFAYASKEKFNDLLKDEQMPVIPSMKEYQTKEPIILMKDSFGRWLIVTEWDYELPGGCGKPVVYLYPTKPTEVSIHFEASVTLTRDIPKYANGWKVLAEPNGVLHDLQRQYTNCSQFDVFRFGSEYSKKACETNNYPYIYWAGNVQSINYETPKEGWIVAKSELALFMDKKLDEVGLTKTEKSDMLSYWMPEMLRKNAPYYRISFLQTAQLNRLIPMRIFPKPDNINRIFLDYEPLQTIPTESLRPQVLRKFSRVGFTVIEWGGKKR